MFFTSRVPSVLFIVLVLFATSVNSTVVEVRTVEGNFQINLFDDATPQSVANFLSYVNSGAYASNVVHRSSENFVIQMGGFQYNGSFPPDSVPAGVAVNNEPVLSNVRGTISYAKLSGNPNSATSQFFVNLSDNASNLDVQNSGFTVFGQVLGDGMEVVDRIAALPTFSFSSPYNELPLRNYTATDFNTNQLPDDDSLVLITDIVVIDATTITNPDLNPIPNTLINSPSGQPTPVQGSSGSGGSIGILFLVTLFSSIVCRYKSRCT